MFVFTLCGYKTKNMFLSSQALDTGDVTSAQSTDLSCTSPSEEHVIGDWSGYNVESLTSNLGGYRFWSVSHSLHVIYIKDPVFEFDKKKPYFSRYKGIIYFVAKNSPRFPVAINSRFHSCPSPLSFLYIFNIVQLVFVLNIHEIFAAVR